MELHYKIEYEDDGKITVFTRDRTPTGFGPAWDQFGTFDSVDDPELAAQCGAEVVYQIRQELAEVEGVEDADPQGFAIDESAPYWKARFIVTQDGGVDLPPDRHDIWLPSGEPMRGPKTRRKFLDEMSAVFPPNDLFEVIRSKLKAREILTREAKQVVLLDDSGWLFTANSNASAGYLYVEAHKVTSQ